MMARIVTQKPDPGNRVGLHYSPFQQSSPIRAPSIQLLARARSTQNRILEQPIREVGLTPVQTPSFAPVLTSPSHLSYARRPSPEGNFVYNPSCLQGTDPPFLLST